MGQVWWVAPPGAAKTNADGRPEFPYKAGGGDGFVPTREMHKRGRKILGAFWLTT